MLLYLGDGNYLILLGYLVGSWALGWCGGYFHLTLIKAAEKL